jgi:hypothetical protein
VSFVLFKGNYLDTLNYFSLKGVENSSLLVILQVRLFIYGFFQYLRLDVKIYCYFLFIFHYLLFYHPLFMYDIFTYASFVFLDKLFIIFDVCSFDYRLDEYYSFTLQLYYAYISFYWAINLFTKLHLIPIFLILLFADKNDSLY